MFFGVLNFKFCDLRWHVQNIWQSSYKVLIPLTRVQHRLQCTEYSVLTVLNWKRMATEARVNTANRFDPDFWRIQHFILLLFFFFTFFSCFLSKFCEFFLFSISRKTGDLSLVYLPVDPRPFLHLLKQHMWQGLGDECCIASLCATDPLITDVCP